MADIKQRFEFDDGGMIQGLKAIHEAAVSIEKSFDEIEKGSGKLSSEMKKDLESSRKAMDEAVKSLDMKADAVKKVHTETSEWRKETDGLLNRISLLGVSVGDVREKANQFGSAINSAAGNMREAITQSKAWKTANDALKRSYDATIGALANKIKSTKAYSTATAAATKATGAMNVVLKAFRVALASTGVGLLIVALGTLVSYFTNTQRGADKLNVVLRSVRATIDVLVDRASRFGEGLSKIFAGKWREGFNDIKESLSGVGAEMKNAYNAAGELEKRTQALTVRRREFTVEEEKMRTKLQQLREEAQEEGKTLEERMELMEQVSALENKLADERIAIAQEELDVFRERSALSESMNEDLDEEARLTAELERIEGQRARNNRRWIREINSLNQRAAAQGAELAKSRFDEMEKENEKAKELQNTYLGLVDTIEQMIDRQTIDLLDGRERLAEQKRQADAEIDLLQARAMAAALAANATEEEIAALQKRFDIIRKNTDEIYGRQAQELSRKESPIIDALAPELDNHGKAKMDKAAKDLSEYFSKAMGENEEAFKNIRDQIYIWMGITPEDQVEIEEAAFMLFDAFGAAYSDSIDQQIEENNRLIDALRERGNAIEAELERELKAQEEGRAHNVEIKRQELEEIRKEEERAARESERLMRRQEAAQRVSSIVQQGMNLMTAVSEIMKSTAGIPLVGIAMAGISVASMFSMFNQAKSQAASVTRLYKGGLMSDYLPGETVRRSGMIKPGGYSDVPGRGNGLHVLGTNMVLNGDEFVVNPEASRQYLDILESINSGTFEPPKPSLLPTPAVALQDMQSYNRLVSLRNTQIKRAEKYRREMLIVDAMDRNFHALMRQRSKRPDRMSLRDYKGGFVEFYEDGTRRTIRK